MSIPQKGCWDILHSANHKPKPYFVFKNSGVSQWGVPPREKSEILPTGWELHLSKECKQKYYYNIHDGRTQWEIPTKDQGLPVPEGWKEMRSTRCKNLYYMNIETKETQWEYPQEIHIRGVAEDIQKEQPEKAAHKGKIASDTHQVKQNLTPTRRRRRQRQIEKLKRQLQMMSERNKKLTTQVEEDGNDIMDTREIIAKQLENVEKIRVDNEKLRDALNEKHRADFEGATKAHSEQLQSKLAKVDYESLFDDVRRFVQADLRGKEHKYDQEIKDYDENYDEHFNRYVDEDKDDVYEDATSEPDDVPYYDARDYPSAGYYPKSEAQQMADELRVAYTRNSRFGPQYEEVEPKTKDSNGIGLPHPRQNRHEISREKLEKTRDERPARDVPGYLQGYHADGASYIPLEREHLEPRWS